MTRATLFAVLRNRLGCMPIARTSSPFRCSFFCWQWCVGVSFGVRPRVRLSNGLLSLLHGTQYEPEERIVRLENLRIIVCIRLSVWPSECYCKLTCDKWLFFCRCSTWRRNRRFNPLTFDVKYLQFLKRKCFVRWLDYTDIVRRPRAERIIRVSERRQRKKESKKGIRRSCMSGRAHDNRQVYIYVYTSIDQYTERMHASKSCMRVFEDGWM